MAQNFMSRSTGAAASCVLVAALVACGDHQEPDEASSFTGPWASDMAEMSESFPSEFAARVFEDGTVSEQELLEAKQIVSECFDTAGLSAEWDAYGRLAVEGSDASGDEPPPAMGQCSFIDGGVMVMYYRMLVNPENRDEMDLRADCLVSIGVVEPGFTGRDLQQAYDTESVPWNESDDRAQACMVDPLGLVGPDAPA